MAFDCLVLLAISLVAEAIAFSAPQGRAVICGDSAQYVAAAEALLDPGQTPHFELRKPGYPLFLAAVMATFGRPGWAAIVCNHVLLALLPLAAYGFGSHLHSRLLGWVAAALTIVQLQSAYLGNRVMSDVLFTAFLSFGLLVFVVGLRRDRAGAWLAASGALLGLAWLTRGTAVAVIPVAAVAIVVVYWRRRRRMGMLCAAFGLPVVLAVVFECSLNSAFVGRFRPSNGAAGSCTWGYRMGFFQGARCPETADGDRLLALLPERGADEAFVCCHLDQWVARYRAVQDAGMNDWDYDNLCRRVALSAIRADPLAYVRCSARQALHHLLRRGEGFALSPVPEGMRKTSISHPAMVDEEEGERFWYAYWGLPHLMSEESVGLVDRMKADAAERAPFGDSKAWSALRYWKTKPAIAGALAAMTWLGDLWPGFALVLCAFLGLNRTTCCVLAAAYVVEAVLVSAVTITDARLQFVWLATDTTLAAALPTVVVFGIAHRVRDRLRGARWTVRIRGEALSDEC